MKLTRLIFKQLLDILSFDDKEDVLLDHFNVITNTRIFSIRDYTDKDVLIYAQNKEEAARKYIKTAHLDDLIYQASYEIDSQKMIDTDRSKCGICEKIYVDRDRLIDNHYNLHTREEISEYIFNHICLTMELSKDAIIV